MVEKIDWNKVWKVRPHNTKESYNHFITKCAIFKYLYDKGYLIYTEYEAIKGRVADIVAIKKDEGYIFEIESKQIPKKVNELLKIYETTDYIVEIIYLEKIDFNKNLEKEIERVMPL